MTTTGRVIDSHNRYFEDLQVGDRIISAARTITESDLVWFSGLSGDCHPLHTDEVFAQTGPFGARVAHGCLTLSIATGLEFRMMGPGESRILASYGMDRVRFVKPVFIGDTIHLECEIVERQDKDENRGVVAQQQEIKNQHGDTVVVLIKRLLYKKRPSDA